MIGRSRSIWTTLALVLVLGTMGAFAQPLLDPGTLAKYIDPLPQPPIHAQDGKWNRYPYYEVHLRAAKQKMHSQLDSTTVFTFDGVTPGPTIRVETGSNLFVRYYNELPQHHILHVDTMINVMKGKGWGDRSRFVAHLHGGDIPDVSDGWPTSTINPGQNAMHYYPSTQPAATLWYHDHSAGITRLNTYAGFAGFYIITDRHESRLNMPSGPYELTIAVQDRTFYANGQLYYPDQWTPDYFGNAALVNGVVWPKQEVEPRKYRIRLLNASNGRFFSMKLLAADSTGNVAGDSAGGPAFYMVGTDQGLVNNTVVLNDPTNPLSPRLLVAPGDRRDIIIDFAGKQGRYFLMHNNAPAPFDGTFPPDPENPLPELFLVHVKNMTVRDRSEIPMHPGSVATPDPGQAALTRDFFLHEIDSAGRTVRALLNDKRFTDATSDFPTLGTTEIWRYININTKVHPMHLHLVNFQVLDRTPFDMDTFRLTGRVVFTGPAELPVEQEAGRKDMVNCPPNYVTRVLTSPFNRVGRYLHDSYDLDLQENEWMRPFEVVQSPGGGMIAGIDPLEATLSVSGPDPFRNRAKISYGVGYEQRVRLGVYNALGQEVKTLVYGMVTPGAHSTTWDGSNNAGTQVAAGTYFYKLETNGGAQTRRATLLR